VPAPLFRGSWSLSNTMWPGPRPTSIPSGILNHPIFWRQQTDRQADRADNGPIAYRAKQTVAQKRDIIESTRMRSTFQPESPITAGSLDTVTSSRILAISFSGIGHCHAVVAARHRRCGKISRIIFPRHSTIVSRRRRVEPRRAARAHRDGRRIGYRGKRAVPRRRKTHQTYMRMCGRHYISH